MTTSRVLQAALAEPWAITADGLQLVLSVASRENTVSVEALEAYRAEHVPHAERLKKRGSVAVIEASGPMLRRANFFSAISGATSYDVLRRDLQAALDDPAIKAIVLNLDTPGGEVTGVDELAKAIKAGTAQKKIVAYVGGTAASAGYWLASQASEIVISETAILGSIGVRAALQDTSKKDAEAGKIEFISSKAPGKRVDLSTDEGRARIQRTIDALESVFINTVAEGRGVKGDDVTANFGGGDVLIGAAAVAAGMADRIGNFEAVISELAGRSPSPSTSRRTAKMNEDMIAKAEHTAAVEAARKEGATAERDRVKAILALDEAKDKQASALHLALTTDLAPDAMKAVLVGLAASTPVAAAPHGGERSDDAPNGLVPFDPKTNKSVAAAEKTKGMFASALSAVNSHAQ